MIEEMPAGLDGDEPSPTIAAASPATTDTPAEVSFVVPPPAYDSIDTGETLDPPDLAAVPAPSPADLGPAIRAVEAMGEMIAGKLDRLASAFDREVRAEATREKTVDRLHAELQDYKQDLLLKVMRPVFIDLIQLHDDIGKMADSAASDTDPAGSERFRGLLGTIRQGIEDVLYRQGVEPFEHDSDAFDARRQRAVSTVPTDDPSLARRVADRHRKGFSAGDKVIRPEVVSVFVHRPATG